MMETRKDREARLPVNRSCTHGEEGCRCGDVAREEAVETIEYEICEWLRKPRDDGGDWFRIYRDLADAIERGEYRKS